MNFRSAKIVCTLGPASDSADMIERLMRAGMDVARLNFSHGTHEEHARTIKRLREASARLSKPIGILADLQGPKIRTGALVDGQHVQLRAGQRFTISTLDRPGTSAVVSTTYKRLPRDVSRGNRILLGDGLIELRVLSTTSNSVLCQVVNGGELGEHKGINLPGVKLRIPAVTARDRNDLAFALRHGANFIAVSFVRSAEDVLLAKSAVTRARKNVPIIAKLEKPEAIENLDAILRVADGVMVARGDLGVEMSPEKVPVIQKLIIAKACEARLPVITATQMLESMTQNPRPTRAEASDVLRRNRRGIVPYRSSGNDGPHHPRSRVQRFARPAAATRAIQHRGDGRRTDLSRFRRIANEGHRRIHGNRLDGPLDFKTPAAPSHNCLFDDPGNKAETLALLGRGAANNRQSAKHRGASPRHRKAPARRASRQAWGCRGNRGRDAAVCRRHDELHEVSRDRQQR